MRRRLLAVFVVCVAVLGCGVVVALAARTRHRRHNDSAVLLGNHAIEGNGDTEPAGRSEAFRFRGSASGTARSIVLFVDLPNAASTVEVGIYTSAGDHPRSLLSSGQKTHPTPRAWNTIGIHPVQLRRGATYWVAVLGIGGAAAYRDARSGPCVSEESAQTNLTHFPSLWRSGPRWRSCPLSAIVSSKSAPTPPAKPTPPPPRPVPPPPPNPVPPVSGGRNCISHPSACGYPDASNTGTPAGTKLTSRSGDVIVTTPGSTISGWSLDGTIEVKANNVTITNTDVTVNGTQAGCNSPCGGHGIWVAPNVKGTVIQDVTCHGGASSGDNVTEFCIQSNDSSTVVNRVHTYNCTTCFVGPGSYSNSFVDQTGATIPQEHYEDIYFGGGDPSLVVNHNTLLQPQSQTAVVFVSHDFGDVNTVIITNNLMAGGGWVLYGGGSGNSGSVRGPVTVTGNRIARIYHPKGGYYGVSAYFNDSATTWSGNIWDDTLATIPY